MLPSIENPRAEESKLTILGGISQVVSWFGPYEVKYDGGVRYRAIVDDSAEEGSQILVLEKYVPRSAYDNRPERMSDLVLQTKTFTITALPGISEHMKIRFPAGGEAFYRCCSPTGLELKDFILSFALQVQGSFFDCKSSDLRLASFTISCAAKPSK